MAQVNTAPDGISTTEPSPNKHDIEKSIAKDPDGAGAPELAEVQDLRFVSQLYLLIPSITPI